jgi:hypothetical protein
MILKNVTNASALPKSTDAIDAIIHRMQISFDVIHGESTLELTLLWTCVVLIVLSLNTIACLWWCARTRAQASAPQNSSLQEVTATIDEYALEEHSTIGSYRDRPCRESQARNDEDEDDMSL